MKRWAKAWPDFAQLFAELDEPFARLYKALALRIDLFVGVPGRPASRHDGARRHPDGGIVARPPPRLVR